MSSLDQEKSTTHRVGKWVIEIVAYQFGNQHVCIISNVDPGATICRHIAPTAQEALDRALQEASASLWQTDVVEVAPKKTEKGPVERIVLCDDGGAESVTLGRFMEMPIQTRMQRILEGKAIFYNAAGQIIRGGDAIELLHAAAA